MTLATSAAIDRDQRLALVLDALMKQHGPIDWSVVAREHADLVDEIKQLLAVGQMIDFVKQNGSNASTVAYPGPASASRVQLPSTFGGYELLEEIGRGG